MNELRLATLDAGSKAIDAATLDALQDRLRGRLIDPAMPAYEEARTIWNAMIDRKPGLIVSCMGTADIIEAVRFVRVYRNSGFPVGHRYEHAAIAAAGTVLFSVMGYTLLAPIACSAQPLGERFINVAYPVLDFIVLVPMLVLLRITSHFRGGRVWSVWATLLAGFAVASGADIVFAYVSSIHERSLQPLQDPMFVGSYFLLACGAALQLELLSD